MAATVSREDQVVALHKAMLDGAGQYPWLTIFQIRTGLSHCGVPITVQALREWLDHLVQQGKIELLPEYQTRYYRWANGETHTDKGESLEDKVKEEKETMVLQEQPQNALTLRPTMSIDDLMERERFIQEMIDRFLILGVDYGPPFPDSEELCLYKSGAEKFMAAFELRPDYIEVEKVIQRASDSVATEHIRYEYRCNLHLRTLGGPIVGTAIGICSSEEDKYKYRKQERTCPECGEPAILRSRYEDKKTGDKGWYCFKKIGGCGANFVSTDERITRQEVGRKINPDMMGLQHTISAMAQKRAFVLALRTTTGLSAYFTSTVSEAEAGKLRVTIDGKGTVKPMASVASELIDFAEKLLPEGHGYSRNQIGASCLSALEIEGWEEFSGDMDSAKSKIADKLNTKNGTGHKHQDTPEQSAADPQITEDVPEIFDTKEPPLWVITDDEKDQLIKEAAEFWGTTSKTATRKNLVKALGLQGEAKNDSELIRLISSAYHGDYGMAMQAVTLFEVEA